ncbi:ectonucleoside triphosphate diphosphohydrolase 5-like isoform X1 [Lates japonicus]|uniref:Ectonucleoside triphosphate diphosphohydrolase 5-like isoform X1 n=1 Tax=Lates japonicus TaxID=270547 RepID=A0AAD3MRE2_LATJO|nr:ectonucleoside triphosphate diphosphohydrolase 5-like isoform X1 [Lates japonicus]
MTEYPPISPFLCMDLTYITCLLKDGFGFKESTVLQLTKKVNNVQSKLDSGCHAGPLPQPEDPLKINTADLGGAQ